MQRHLLGIIGASLVVTGLVLLAQYGTGNSNSSMFASVCLRAGLVMAAIWLALPQLLSRSPPWMTIAFVVGILAIVWRPQLAIIVGPLLAALAVLYFVRWLSQPFPTSQRTKETGSDISTKEELSDSNESR